MPEKAIAREKEIQIAAIQQEEEQMHAVARKSATAFFAALYALTFKGFGRVRQLLTPQDLLEFRDRHWSQKTA